MESATTSTTTTTTTSNHNETHSDSLTITLTSTASVSNEEPMDSSSNITIAASDVAALETEADINWGDEPPNKKLKKFDSGVKDKLEFRLGGILCCSVCLDLPKSVVYQCVNGHLMCAGCFTHLLADARLKDETATCPGCRCIITKDICSRNLAVEKAVNELPGKCCFCLKELPRVVLEKHQTDECDERLVKCTFHRIGCPWRGPAHELGEHESLCIHPNKCGRDILGALEAIDKQGKEEKKLYDSIFDLLSCEKITFNDLQFKPYRTDEFIHRLYYETSRFTAFGNQWVVKGRVNDDQKDPSQSCERKLSYQLVLKSKITSPIVINYLILKGPFGDMKVSSRLNRHEFNETSTESGYIILPLIDSNECNKLLAAKVINFRLIMFQTPK